MAFLSQSSDTSADHGTTQYRPSRRLTKYVIGIAILAAVVCFTDLGRPDLWGDEATYAVISDDLRESGDWLLPTKNGKPYLSKPPLYFWLTALTHDLFPGDELPHRVWAAAAGAATVALTVVLGARLFSPEVGLLAGLLLLSNQMFMIFSSHGMRRGVMESSVCFTITAAVLASVLAFQKPHRRNRWWCACGLAAGTACMFKPLVGLPMLALLTVHAVIFDDRDGLASRLSGPARAWAAATVVALPWWFLALGTWGSETLVGTFRTQLVNRAMSGFPRHLEGPLFYWAEISGSSLPFVLVIPALAACLFLAFRGSQRPADALIALTACGWLVFISLSKSKLIWYAFPTFPLLAMAVGRLFISPLERLRVGVACRGASFEKAAELFLWVGLAVGCFVLVPAVRTKAAFIDAHRFSRPWRAYQFLESRAQAETMVLIGIPCRSDPHKSFYSSRMRNSIQIEPSSLSSVDPQILTRSPAVWVCKALPPPKRLRVASMLDQVESIELKDDSGTLYALGPTRHELAAALDSPTENVEPSPGR